MGILCLPNIMMSAQASILANKSARLTYHTTYQTLRPINNLHQRAAAYTYNGISRCPRCLCLQSDPQAHRKACKGRLRPRAHGIPCSSGCGLLLSSEDKARKHALLCPGLLVTLDRYSTSICPKCHISGFGPVVIARHIRNCNGERARTLRSYAKGQPIYRCEGCEDYFLRNALRTHACRCFGDPVWLGEAGPPDLSISYIRWCRGHNLTLGGSPGRMPDAVPDTTIAVPIHTGPAAPSIADGHGLALGDDDDDGEETDDEQADDAEPGRDPRDTLASAGISFERFEPTRCAGVVWRHGSFACPFKETITLDNVRLIHVNTKEDKAIQMDCSCKGCASLLRRIRKWICEGKYSPEGVQLCRRTACTQRVMALWHCRFHAAQRTRYHHADIIRRSQARAITPDAMTGFLAGLDAHKPKLVSPAWCAVRKMLWDAPTSKHNVFFVDTESVYDRVAKGFLVCEMALISAQGNVVFHSLVDHALSFRQLRERVDAALWSKLDRVYHFADLDAVTRGRTPNEIGIRLSELGVCPDAYLIEWSLNGFDLRALRDTFTGHASLFPRAPLLGHQLWRALGLQGSVALQTLFRSYQPASLLNETHHEAAIDAAKLFEMVRGALQLFA